MAKFAEIDKRTMIRRYRELVKVMIKVAGGKISHWPASEITKEARELMITQPQLGEFL